MRPRAALFRHAHALAALVLGACAGGDLPESGDADAPDADEPLLSAQASGRPGSTADQWLPMPESWLDAGDLGSADASDPGAQSPPHEAGDDPDAGAAPVNAPPTEAPAPATEAPAPATQPPAPATEAPPEEHCEAEICNGLDDDCDGAIDNGAACPCEMIARNGETYLVCGNQMSWFAARNVCHGVGYDLAVINDAAEDAFLFGELQRRGYPGTWIGLNDHAAEGQWVWLDDQPALYTHWDSGEPNDGGDGGEDCGIVMTNDDRASKWDDRGCDGARPFLCEVDQAGGP